MTQAPQPETLPQWLARLRRRGVRCRLQDGRVRVSGLRSLSPTERGALFASAPQVQALLEARAQRRQREHPKKEQQQSQAAAIQQRERRVVGQVVSPGGPLRLLFEDECKDIRPSPRARVLQGITYGWKVGGE